MAKLDDVKDLVSRGRSKLIAAKVQEALDDGSTPQEILDAMIDTMGEVGDRFSRDEIFVPEMLISAKTMKNGLAVLEPLLAEGATENLGTCIIGTVEGDLHDIGKNLVAMMLESSGFEVIDLGVDVDKNLFQTTLQENPDTKIVCCSALLTTTMPALKETVAMLNDQPNRKDFSVMIGGAPITDDFAKDVGADYYSPDAAGAAQTAKAAV